MDAPANLPPELQEVEDELQAALEKGGPEACRMLVNGLAAEATLGKTIADEAELVILETEEDAETFPEISESSVAYIDKLDKTRLAGMLATIRYSYAAMRIGEIERATR